MILGMKKFKTWVAKDEFDACRGGEPSDKVYFQI